MGKKKTRVQQKKHVKKESNFDKLVKLKTEAQKKKIKKAQIFVNETKPQQVQSISDINRKTIKEKITKKNLFDIDSEDEDLQRTQFFSEQNDLFNTEEDQMEQGQQTQQKKSKQTIFKELIKKSKDSKRQKQIQQEKNKDKIDDINEQFKQIQGRLIHTDKQQIKNEQNQQEDTYEKLLQQISQDKFVKSNHHQNDNNQNNIHKKKKQIDKEENYEEESEHVELKKSDRKNQQIKGILKFNSAFSNLKKSSKNRVNNSEEEDESSDEEDLL